MARNQIKHLLEGTVSIRAYVSRVAYHNKRKMLCFERAVVNRSIPVDHFWVCSDSFTNTDLISLVKNRHKNHQVIIEAEVSTYYKLNEGSERVLDYCFTNIKNLEFTGYIKEGKYDFRKCK